MIGSNSLLLQSDFLDFIPRSVYAMLLRKKEEEVVNPCAADYHVLANDFIINRSYMESHAHKDRILMSVGPDARTPPVTVCARHSNRTMCCMGISVYETRTGIRYVSLNLRDIREHGNTQFFMFCKGDLFRFARYARRQNIQLDYSPPPLLKAGQFEDITDNTLNFLKKSKFFASYGVKLTRGIVLHGEPGNGKTMICKWLRGMCSRNNYVVRNLTSSTLEQSYSDDMLEDTVNGADIVFFDDIDVSFFSRTEGGNAKMACALLSAMDGMSGTKHATVRVFTTNELIKTIDPAFMRPGRIDKVYQLERPDIDLRRSFVSTHWNAEISGNIDVEFLVGKTHEFSFAELDEIKMLLVLNKSITGKWCLDSAFADFKKRGLSASKRVGFAKD